MSSTNAQPPALRWGFLGCGKISNDFANALKNLPTSAILHACAARSFANAQDFASTHEFAHAYDSYEALCADPNVDVVYIGTLHISHFEHTMLALNHSKHVLVEKPMAMNVTQAAKAIGLAKEKGVFFMEGMWTRFFPATRFVKKLLAEGHIGEVHHVNADIGFAFPADASRIWERELGGGGLLDIGIYPLAWVTLVFGTQPETVSAVGKLSDQGVDLYSTVTLEYSGNRFGAIQYSCLAQMGETTTIIGSKGRIHVHSPSHAPTEVVIIKYLADGELEEKKSLFPIIEAAPNATPNLFGKEMNGFFYEAQAVTELIWAKKQESDEYSRAESLGVMTIMDKVRKDLGVVYPADTN